MRCALIIDEPVGLVPGQGVTCEGDDSYFDVRAGDRLLWFECMDQWRIISIRHEHINQGFVEVLPQEYPGYYVRLKRRRQPSDFERFQ